MFIVLVTYHKPLAEVDRHLVEHRAYLEECYQKDFLVVSGPQNPRIGGVIISNLTDKSQLEKILEQDPFSVHGIASYQIIEFEPVKYHKNFSSFIL